MRLRPAAKMRQKGTGSVYHAPEIDAHQPGHLRIVELVELAQQRNTGIVDDDAEGREFRYGRARELFDLFGVRDIDAVNRDPPCMRGRHRFGNRLQTAGVDVGQRQIAAARRKFQRERPADAARCPGYRRRGSLKVKCLHITPRNKQLFSRIRAGVARGPRQRREICALQRTIERRQVVPQDFLIVRVGARGLRFVGLE